MRTRARLALDDARDEALKLGKTIVNPPQLQDKLDGADRVGQILAFLFLGPVVMVSLQLVVVVNELMTATLGVQSLGSGQDPIFAWLVTALTGGLFLVAAWTWFQFVRTAAFGFFRW